MGVVGGDHREESDSGKKSDDSPLLAYSHLHILWVRQTGMLLFVTNIGGSGGG